MGKKSKNHFGKQIKRLRNKRNLSQSRFGKKLGLSGQAISAYETGKSMPPPRVLRDITAIYNTTFVELPTESRKVLSQKINALQIGIKELKEVLLL